MEIVLTFAILLAIAIVLYLFVSRQGKHLPWQVRSLIVSALVCLTAGLWCAVYGPDVWVLIQAGALIVLGTITSILSSSKN